MRRCWVSNKHPKSMCDWISSNFLLSFHRGDNKVLKFGDEDQYVAGRNDVLGQGGFGIVYRAKDKRTGLEVAVKTELKLKGTPSLPNEIDNYALIGPNRKSTANSIWQFIFFSVEFYISTITYFLFFRWNSKDLFYGSIERRAILCDSHAVT